MSACEYWEELICAEADGEITDEERAALEAHLDSCEHCRRYRDAVNAVSAALTEDMAEVPEAFAFSVMTKLALQEEMQERREDPSRYRFAPRRVIGLVASLLLIAGLGFAVGRNWQSTGAASSFSASAPQMMAVMDSAPAESAEAEEETDMVLYSVAETTEEAAATTTAGAAKAESAAAGSNAGMAAAAANDYRADTTTEGAADADGAALAAIVSAAWAYVEREMPQEADTVPDADSPLVEELEGAENGYLPALEGYLPQGRRYAVSFSTTADALLGPIVVLVDETATVYGVLPRE